MLLPIFLFFIYLYYNAVNVPYIDDLDMVSTINEIQASPYELLEILVRQQNDHRILFSRLGVLAVYLFTDKINFRYTILLGFFNLVLLAYAFYLVYTSFRKGIGLFIPVIILLFSPNVYANHICSISSYQHTLSVAFSIISLYFLSEEKKTRWYWSLPFAMAASLTILDGLSVLPVGLFWLIVQRRYCESLLYTAFAVVWLLIYFSDFQFSGASSESFSNASFSTILSNFVAFVGSSAKVLSDTNAVAVSTILGGFILFGCAVLFLYRTTADDPKLRVAARLPLRIEFIDICFLRLLATSAMIAIGRSYNGAEEMMAVRFQIFSISILILFYLLLVRTIQVNGPMAVLFVVGSIFINIYSYLKYEKAVAIWRQELKADAYNYRNNQTLLHQNSPDPPQGFFKNYEFPDYFHQGIIHAWKRSSPHSSAIKITAKEVPASRLYGDYTHPILDLEVHNVPNSIPPDESFLLFQSHRDTSKCYLVGLHDKDSWLKTIFNDSTRTFSGYFPLKIPKDAYKVSICWIKNKRPQSILISSRYVL